MRTTSSLYAVAGIFALVAVMLWIIPPRVAVPAVSPAAVPVAPPAPDGSEQAAALLEYQGIVQANVLSPDRTPPATRYVPPGATVQDSQPPPPRPAPAAPRFILYGVASGPSGAVALIDADRAIPGAEIYRPGDRVGGYRLDVVADTFVVLRGAADSLVLRLQLPRRRLP
jgi:hypothetical protein